MGSDLAATRRPAVPPPTRSPPAGEGPPGKHRTGSSGEPLLEIALGVKPAIPIVTGIVCPDHALAVLAPSHRTSSAHHSTGIKAQELLNSLTAHVIDMRGRGDKAISGNCCSRLHP